MARRAERLAAAHGPSFGALGADWPQRYAGTDDGFYDAVRAALPHFESGSGGAMGGGGGGPGAVLGSGARSVSRWAPRHGVSALSTFWAKLLTHQMDRQPY